MNKTVMPVAAHAEVGYNEELADKNVNTNSGTSADIEKRIFHEFLRLTAYRSPIKPCLVGHGR